MNEQDIMIEVNHMSHIYTDENGNDVRAVSYTHLDVYKRQIYMNERSEYLAS